MKYLSVIVLLLSLVGWLTSCGAVAKPAPPSMPTIGFLTIAPAATRIELIKAGLKDLGRVETETVKYIVKDAGGDNKQVPQVAQAMVEAKPDVIIIVGSALAKAVMTITKDIPLVVLAGEPIKDGLVPSLKDHGLNITGVATFPPAGLQLEYLLKIAPQTKRILVPFNPEQTGSEPANLATAEEAAKSLGLELVISEARNNEEVAQQLANFNEKVDAIFIPTNRLASFNDDETFIPFAVEHKLPLVVSTEISVKNGAFMSYGVDLNKTTQIQARLADQILKGTPAAQLPFETTDYFLTINLKTAEAIGVTVPDDVLHQANNIIR